MIFPTPPPTNELPPAVLEQDIRNWRINTPFAGDGYAPSLRSFSNLGNTRTESIHNWERERLLRQIKAETDAGKNRVMRLFETRLEADRAFLEGIETSKITAYCSNSVEVMAAFFAYPAFRRRFSRCFHCRSGFLRRRFARILGNFLRCGRRSCVFHIEYYAP